MTAPKTTLSASSSDLLQDFVSPLLDDRRPAFVHLVGSQPVQAAMTVARIIPLHKAGAKHARLVQVAKKFRITGAGLEGGEQALDERVVIAHVGRAARDLDLSWRSISTSFSCFIGLPLSEWTVEREGSEIQR